MKIYLNVTGVIALLLAFVILLVGSSAVHEIEAAIVFLIACSSLGFANVIEKQTEHLKVLNEVKDAIAKASSVAATQPSAHEPRIVVPPVPGTEDYFIASDGKAAGPHKLESLRNFLERGKITQETMIFKQGAAEWKPLRDLVL